MKLTFAVLEKSFIHLALIAGFTGILGGYARCQGQIAAAIAKPNASTSQLDKAQQLNTRIHQLYKQGQYANAIPLAHSAVKIHEKVLGSEHPRTATSLNNLALLYLAHGQYKESEILFQRALGIREKRLKSDHPQIAATVNNLGTAYRAQAKYHQAGQLFKRALELRQEILKAEHPAILQSLTDLARLYQNRGDYPNARLLYRKDARRKLDTLLESENLNLPKDLRTVQRLLNRAQEQEGAGNYAEAERLRQQALAIPIAVSPTPRPESDINGSVPDELALSDPLMLAEIYNNLGLLEKAEGRSQQAETYLRSAILLQKNAVGFKHPDFATSLHNLAELFSKQGDYLKAEFILRCVLDVQKKNFTPGAEEDLKICGSEEEFKKLGDLPDTVKHPNVAKTLNNLAKLYSAQGKYKIAEPLYQKTFEIRKDPKVLGPNHPEVAVTLHGLGELNLQQENYGDAKHYMDSALAIRKKAVDNGSLDPKSPDLARSYSGLGEYHKARGNYPEAESYFKQALDIVEDLFGSDPVVALALDILGDLEQEQGNYEEAEDYHQRSLKIRLASLGDDHPDVAESYRNLSWLALAQGETEQACCQRQIAAAIAYMTKATEIEDKHLGSILTIGSETRKRSYMETLAETTNGTVSLHVQYAPDSPQAARLALTNVLRRKGRILDALAGSLKLLRERLNDRDRELLDELNSTRSQLANLIYNPPSNEDNVSKYKTRVAQLKSKEEALAEKLARRSAEFAAQSEPEITIESIQQLIPNNSALVEFVSYRPVDPQTKKFGEPRYVAYIVHSQGELQWVELGDAKEIDQAVLEFRQSLREKSSNVKTIAREVDFRVMQPIRQRLGDAQFVLVAPDSQLSLIPFAALVDEGGRYLVDRYNFNYLSSGRDLLHLKETTPSQESLILLADPNYDFAEVTTVEENPPELPKPDLRGLTDPSVTTWAAFARATLPFFSSAQARSRDLELLKFSELLGTAEEEKGITKLLPEFTVLTKKKATENFVKELEQAPKILHIATHGFFLETEPLPAPDRVENNTSLQDDFAFAVVPRTNASHKSKLRHLENPLIRSGIALAGFNKRQSGLEDGVLTALEAAGLNLGGTDLVVLSACETGLGDIANGEGVYGLRRAIAIAGSDSQLMSLWKVSDEGTKDLMVEYYERLKEGVPRSEALRQVQSAMLHSGNQQHPFFWAAFTPSGDWQPVFSRF
ncbi:tetratricopeptide repeat protein [Lusitaniella coriacea LEGE 07157]|uniref:Tetratricopeptide repeat protein n=1 Tax=Lusitaniella coriacea LEGE 07157 TaxID=945747 RepID=A0A8J7DTV9_9CYAN|nr:tetratricopeptide repeat protein [Lusitaniella coriacea]MBE9114336.1 tetratricopeptide repeat protein [Lusitaniella coriacea LEGE 07157]